MNKNYEYGGIETALNGLTSWIQNNIYLTGSSYDKWQKACVIITEYAIKNISGFVKRGHASLVAGIIAKKIHRNKKFRHFADWVLSNYSNQAIKR